MAETIKVLGQVAPAAATLTTLYTVPAGKQAVVSEFTVVNRSATTTTIRASVAVAGAADSNEQYIAYDMEIPGSAGRPWPVPGFAGVTLGPGDVVRIYATLATVSFNLFGVEADSASSPLNLVVKEAGGSTFSAVAEVRFVSGDFSVSEVSPGIVLVALSIAAGTTSATPTSNQYSVLSNAVSSLTSAHNVLSNRVSANSGGGASVTSTELSAASAQAASAIASEISNRISADNALSQAISVISTVLSNEASVRAASVQTASAAATSADAHANAVSADLAALSLAVSALSTNVSTLSAKVVSVSAQIVSVDAHAAAASAAATSVDSRVTSVNASISAISARSVGGVSTHGFQSVVNALSNRISAGAGGSVTSTELSAVSAQAASAISVTSAAVTSVNSRVTSVNAAISAISARSVGDVSTHGFQSVVDALSGHISAASAAATSADTHAGTASAAATSADAHAAAASAAATSVNARVNSVNVAVSAISARSVGDVSTHGFQSVINALSNRISAGAGGSVTSTELSAVSAQAASATSVVRADLATLSLAVSALSTNVSTLSAKVVSVSAQLVSIETHASTASLAATSVDARVTSVNLALSAVSSRSVGDVSTHGLQSVINSLSNRISANSVGAAGSVTSTELSAVSAQAASAISVASAAATSIGTRLDSALCVGVSATIGRTQYRFRSNQLSVVSGTALTNLAGLSLSLAAGGIYELKGGVTYENGTSGGFGFGASLPALAGGGSYINMVVFSANNQAVGGAAGGRAAFSAIAAGQTLIASVSAAAINIRKGMLFDGMLQVSAAGTFQLMAKTSVAAASLSVWGGYVKVYRLN